jgi:hypothetical protein
MRTPERLFVLGIQEDHPSLLVATQPGLSLEQLLCGLVRILDAFDLGPCVPRGER